MGGSEEDNVSNHSNLVRLKIRLSPGRLLASFFLRWCIFCPSRLFRVLPGWHSVVLSGTLPCATSQCSGSLEKIKQYKKITRNQRFYFQKLYLRTVRAHRRKAFVNST